MARVRAMVIVLAGPSGSGKSRLADRLGLPVLHLDDFYKSGDDPSLPRLDIGVVDWDDPASWLHDEAVSTVEALCRHGRAQAPVYDIAHDGRTGHRLVELGTASYFVAEGIFAHEIVPKCRELGLLADAICVRHHPLVTFWRRLSRDLAERRKPPLVLLRRGLLLLRQEPQVVARAVAGGCAPLRPDQAWPRVRRLVTRSTATGSPAPRPAPGKQA
jgi:uridine kinase